MLHPKKYLFARAEEANALAWQERSPSGTLPDKRADHTAVITGMVSYRRLFGVRFSLVFGPFLRG